MSDNISSLTVSDTQGQVTGASFNRLTFYPNTPLSLDSLINLRLIASKKIALGYLNMRNFDEVKKNTKEKLQIAYLNLFELAHAIRIVYASCQGELEEKTFWTLVFEKSS